MKLFAALLVVAATVAAAPALAQAPTSPAPITIIHAGALLATPGQPARGRSKIVISGGKITQVTDGFTDVPGARVVDLSTQYVLPGLIDCHVHMESTGDPLEQRLGEAHDGDADNLVNAVKNARTDLLAGFTSVRDLGGDANVLRALKAGIAQGVFEGPTITMAAQMISVTAGHGDGAATLRDDFAHACAKNRTTCATASTPAAKQCARRSVTARRS